MKKENKSIGRLYKIFIYTALVSFAISIIVPVSWVFIASFKQDSEFTGSPWTLPKGIYIQNFIDAFQKAKMGESLWNSVFVTAVALILLIVIALPASYVLARFEFRGRKFWNTFMKAGLFINVNYIVIPIFLMLLKGDKILRQSEIVKGNFFLDNLFILAVIYMTTALPFTIYLLSNFFQSLPTTFEEAAAIDGAGYFTTMIKVMVPMARPSIITVILFNFLAFWNEYIIALTLLPGPKKTLPVGLMSLMAASKGAAHYGILYSGMVIVMLPTLILYILVQQKLTQGMTLGGSKE
ncbi:carbohydrate ABC transporter permease [Pseudoleptotrichia goodfellowii]|jgi:ABC transporter, permease protein|uniref:ABC transporter, permease protein n=1 Tax=Pseudoleptotrichia goodfellowii F0264 TaxID=596323 RepID=D0GIP1_9FUSO|nr:carbohydrate ABC transporter permease [Pseudoleptotrichia goodfellowii]EEY36038.1 ABC transporter, permease protein [Pseudoleptotrichia goodfellowii F0264]